MTERQVTEYTYGRKTFDRKDISSKRQMVEKAWRNRSLADMKFDPIKIHKIEKIYHKPFTPYYIWLPNGVPNDTNSKIGN